MTQLDEMTDGFVERVVVIGADGIEVLLVEELIDEDKGVADGAQVENGLGARVR